MKSFFTLEVNQKILKIAAIYSLLWGFIVTVVPLSVLKLFGVELFFGLEFWQFIGMSTGVMGVGYFIASFDSEKYWPIVFVGFLMSLMGTFIFGKVLFIGSMPSGLSIFMLISHAIWLVPFYYALQNAYETELMEDSVPKKFSSLIRLVRTSQNASLLELSEKQNVLLIFVRHFGCTFCRETVAEMAKIEDAMAGQNLTQVFVHMSDPDFGDKFFAQYYKHPVHHVSDPGRVLYKSLDLKRGSLYQIFGPMSWMRFLYAGVLKGHGLGQVEGDGLQLGGIFVLSKGQVIYEQKALSATHMFHLNTLPKF